MERTAKLRHCEERSDVATRLCRYATPRNDGLEHGAAPALQPLEPSLYNRMINKGKYFDEMTADLWVTLSLHLPSARKKY